MAKNWFYISAIIAAIFLCGTATNGQTQPAPDDTMKNISHLNNFEVFEFRRYITKDGRREQFAQYFESYFPEAFQQLGALAVGQFFDRDNPTRFTWIRAFHSMEDRAIANSAFYYGPLWKEHRTRMNDLLVDNDDVLLLRPLDSNHPIRILPAIDPIAEPKGATGVVVAQIFRLKAGSVQGFSQKALAVFQEYEGVGARPAGILVTLDAKNNFPQLPIRTDGPYLVWLGVVKDNAVLKNQLLPKMNAAAEALNGTGLVVGAPELVILDPAHRSRLRWLN